MSAFERHLLRLFLEHAGVSPLEYLRAIRLERARQALGGGASVTQAAEIAGFRSALQLRRAWSRQWGGSPRDVLRAASFDPRTAMAGGSSAARVLELRDSDWVPLDAKPVRGADLVESDSS